MADLETVDIAAVEILSTGGPVHGQGSPPEGDYWTLDDLRDMEAAAHELADEIQPPNKIGHSDAQQLVANSALVVPTPGEMPAVQTLDDVYALYEARQLEQPENVRAIVFYTADAGSVVWDPEAGFQDLRDDVAEALNGPPTGGMNEPRFWVYDIAVTGDKALVQDYYGDGADGYVVPFTQNADGSVAIAPSSDWTPVEQGWIASAKEFARKNERGAESRPMALELTDADVAQLREKLGLDADTDITSEALTAAADTRANELSERDTKIAELEQKLSERKNEASDAERRLNELEGRVETAEKRAFEMERDTDLEAAVRQGKIDPADLDEWAKDYEDNQAATRRVLERLKPDPTLVRELGRDDAEAPELEEQELSDDFERRFGQRDPLKRSAA